MSPSQKGLRLLHFLAILHFPPPDVSLHSPGNQPPHLLLKITSIINLMEWEALA